MALGAAPHSVLGMVMRRIGFMAFVGGVLGLVGALAIGRFAEGLLYELQGRDPVVLAGPALAVAMVALAAGFVPRTGHLKLTQCRH